MSKLDLKTIGGLQPDDPLYRDFENMLVHYETLLTKKNGRRTRASRTWGKLKRKGIIGCLEDWALSSKPTDAFYVLIENGEPELTAEAIVVRYADRFPVAAVAAAKQKLNYGA